MFKTIIIVNCNCKYNSQNNSKPHLHITHFKLIKKYLQQAPRGVFEECFLKGPDKNYLITSNCDLLIPDQVGNTP